MLSNLYSHEVLDGWFVKTVQPRMKGKAFMVRYADDAVTGCECREDAERVMKVLAARFEKYGLKLHPEKAKLPDFTRPGGETGNRKESFTFLGFTRYWTKSRKGKRIAGRKTAKTRLQRALKAVNGWCNRTLVRANRHKPMRGQWETLKAELIGHYAYYGISLNFRSIAEFYGRVRMLWRGRLNSRSRKGRMSWESFYDYLKDWPLPNPRIMHSYC